MAERFENLDNILGDWAKEKIHISLVVALNRYEKQEDEKNRFYDFRKWLRKKYSSSLSRQSSESNLKEKTKLTLR